MGSPVRATYVDAQLYAMLQAVQKRMARDPGWQVVARGRDWLCPYCGEIGFSEYEPQKAPRRVLKHLVQECPHWGEEVGTRFSVRQLQAKARRLEIEDLLRTSRAWRLTDATGSWYCPYCAEATPVMWRPDAGSPSPPAEDVHAHLETCPANRDGHEPYPADFLSAIIHDVDKYRQYVVAVRCRMEREPGWREADSHGRWICPKCHQALPGVNMTEAAQPLALAPLRIARHLMDGCKSGVAGAPAEAAAPSKAAPDERAPEGSRTPTETQLERAREIVRKALPSQAPVVEGYDIQYLYRPAPDVGGTFYDFFYLSPEHVGIVIGGMPSRGIEGALIMSSVRKSLKLHAQHHRSPAEVLRRTNKDVTGDFDTHTLVTIVYALLDARGATLTYARAGHPSPLLFNPQDEPPFRQLGGKGIALGLQAGPTFDQAIEDLPVRLRQGDTVVLYTAGIAEARNAADQRYGVERLGAALAAAGRAPAAALGQRLFDDLSGFLGSARQTEDITLVCVRCG